MLDTSPPSVASHPVRAPHGFVRRPTHRQFGDAPRGTRPGARWLLGRHPASGIGSEGAAAPRTSDSSRGGPGVREGAPGRRRPRRSPAPAGSPQLRGVPGQQRRAELPCRVGGSAAAETEQRDDECGGQAHGVRQESSGGGTAEEGAEHERHGDDGSCLRREHRGGAPGRCGPHGRAGDGGTAGGGPPGKAAEYGADQRSGCPGGDVRMTVRPGDAFRRHGATVTAADGDALAAVRRSLRAVWPTCAKRECGLDDGRVRRYPGRCRHTTPAMAGVLLPGPGGGVSAVAPEPSTAPSPRSGLSACCTNSDVAACRDCAETGLEPCFRMCGQTRREPDETSSSP